MDFQTAGEADLRRLNDSEVLRYAATANRVLVSHDRRTMPKHFAEFLQHNQSPGVFIISQNTAIKTEIEALLLIWTASEHAEWQNTIVDLPI